MPSPDASVVIPTHNRRESLRRVLEALDHQTVDGSRFEVIVVCDGCTDGTAEMCKRLTTRYALRVEEQAQQGPAAARNAALARAAGDVVVFIDDDVLPDPGLLEQHLAAQAEDPDVVAIGPLLAPPGFALEPWTRWEAAMLEDQYRAMASGRWQPTPRQFYTGNASVRRAHLVEAGGFDTGFRRAEDVELAYRLQINRLHFRFLPEARGWHYARRSLRSWQSTARAYGEADVAMYRRGRLMTLQSMASEFRWRNRRLRALARMSVGRPAVMAVVVGTSVAAARLAGWTGLRSVAQSAYSAAFNLLYWEGVSSRLGGRKEFWRLVETGHGPAPG